MRRNATSQTRLIESDLHQSPSRPEPQPRYSELFLIVVADECIAADAQHAKEESGENHLQPEEKPHRPEENLADLMEFTEAARSPLPSDPRGPCESHEEQTAA